MISQIQKKEKLQNLLEMSIYKFFEKMMVYIDLKILNDSNKDCYILSFVQLYIYRLKWNIDRDIFW